jgi:hypothetical protein
MSLACGNAAAGAELLGHQVVGVGVATERNGKSPVLEL